MRSVFYVVLAVAVLTRSSFVAAFSNTDESQLLSKVIPDFATDVVIGNDSPKRFLRVTDPETVDLTPDDEERTQKFKYLRDIVDKAKEAPKKAAESVSQGAKKIKKITTATTSELEVAAALLALKKSK
ncbi:Avirulence (Avh) protein [Phytophthora megakarya]|uniref:RxLR effector protein n=1 Tax=Phytophthora megakarya TaxID=4795 RepID=A0A225WS85_9STRA|nr:Avirulence (Avh) protein [Phytophthora megakarya]